MRAVVVAWVTVLLLGGCMTASFQQPATDEAKVVIFKEPITVDKNKIFPLVMVCLAENFNSAKTVIQYQDKEAGVIVLKALQSVGRNDFGIDILVNYTLTINIQADTIMFKFMAGNAEALVNNRKVEREISGSEMATARERFRKIKNEVMTKINPDYSLSEPKGKTHREGNITVWTADENK